MTIFQPSRAGLSSKQTILLCVAPALLFLINGLYVHLLKTLQAPVQFYALLPLALILAVLIWIYRASTEILISSAKQFGPCLIIPLLFAIFHATQYETSIGADSASYFTNPVHTFFERGYFSHSEAPFISYGSQPIANYWFPYNAEFIFAGIGSLFDADAVQIAYMMHFTSNYLMGLAILALLMRYVKVIEATILLIAFITLLYVMQSSSQDYSATSLFRGYENKGLIWGYFFWATLNLFTVSNTAVISKKLGVLSALTLAAGGFLVSGNMIFIVFPIIAMASGAMFSAQRAVIGRWSLSFVGTLIISLLVFKMFETTDVYTVITPEMTFRPAPIYAEQAKDFLSPIWLWALAAAICALLLRTNRPLALQLIVFGVVCIFFQSEMLFNIFDQVTPERTLIFWRGAILMNPYVPILIGSASLLNFVSVKQSRIITTVTIVSFTLLIKTSIISMPNKSPFLKGKIPGLYAYIGDRCPVSSTVLANRRIGRAMPIIQPSYKYLVGTEYFLNWQIANLEPGSTEWSHATDVRDASVFISPSPTTRLFGNDPTGFIRTLKNDKPDIVVFNKKRLSSEVEAYLESYNRETFGNNIIFVRKGQCSQP